MSALASVMIALLIHLGGAEIDSSPEARIVRFQEAVRSHVWTIDSPERPDTYVLRSEDVYVFVQRLHDPDLVYTVVVQERTATRPVSMAIVSLEAFMDPLSGGVRREGSGTLPVEEILLGWSASSGVVPGESNDSASGVGPTEGASLTGDDSGADPVATREQHATGTPAGSGQTIHYRWDHREVTVSLRDPPDLFILRY
jgi:hypothetical protein